MAVGELEALQVLLPIMTCFKLLVLPRSPNHWQFSTQRCSGDAHVSTTRPYAARSQLPTAYLVGTFQSRGSLTKRRHINDYCG